jgi:soluble lytic murein transglycosylase-like protein
MPSRRQFLKTITLKPRDYVLACAGAIIAMAILGGIMLLTEHNQPTVISYQEAGITAAWIPPTVRHWDKPITEMSRKYNIDANLIAILMTMESGGDPKATSEAGAQGLMQIMPVTAADISAKHLQKPVAKYDIYDARTNIEFGTAYLALLRDVFGSARHAPDYTRTIELIAAGYNGGAGTASALEKGEGLRDIQPVNYSSDAFNMWRERVSATSPTYERWKARGGDRLLEAASKNQE